MHSKAPVAQWPERLTCKKSSHQQAGSSSLPRGSLFCIYTRCHLRTWCGFFTILLWSVSISLRIRNTLSIAASQIPTGHDLPTSNTKSSAYKKTRRAQPAHQRHPLTWWTPLCHPQRSLPRRHHLCYHPRTRPHQKPLCLLRVQPLPTRHVGTKEASESSRLRRQNSKKKEENASCSRQNHHKGEHS